MKRVLFACVHNAGRSQMAAAFFDQLAEPTKATALSAGTEPGSHVHPEVVFVMQELGLDLSHAVPRRLTPDLAREASLLVTLGCGESCPILPSVPIVDWPLPDPKGQRLDAVRAIRDDVLRRVRELVIAKGWQRELGDSGDAAHPSLPR
ncbi:MAG TPA: arsenate reductase ArsC [Planctomycetota bacterium]|nr:arsenate reductase ArsC [Planctomycetota bacterium]